MMKCLSLWQPWATAVAVGWKHYETRSWARSYRGPVAIHAAKRWTPAEIQAKARELFDKAGLAKDTSIRWPLFPQGAIVGYATIEAVTASYNVVPNLVERTWGDFSPGRFAWLLGGMIALPEPIPFRASQGLFNLDTKTEDKVRAAAGLHPRIEV